MYQTIAAFALATLFAGKLPVLPTSEYIFLLIPVAGFGLWLPRIRLICALTLGLAITIFTGQSALQARLPPGLEGADLVVEGYISALPQFRERGFRFQFKVVECEEWMSPGVITLGWYLNDVETVPRAGQKWKLVVRLNRPHGSVNPGLFDYEAWMLTNGISATGYVRQDPRNTLIEDAGWRYLHQQIRERLRASVLENLPEDSIRGLVVALLIGESAQIDRSIWRILSDTGTNHLLIISGLHVGMVAAIFLRLWQVLLRRLTRRWRVLAGILTITMTIGYGFVAGLGLPVQRALIMVTLGLMALLLDRTVSVWLMFAYALLAVMIINPFITLSAGYWLSFGAVASLIFAFSGRRDGLGNIPGKIIAIIKTQWVVFIAIAPLLICWVMQLSLVSFFVNMLAIPVVAIAVVPMLVACIPLLLVDVAPGISLLETVYYCLFQLVELLTFFADLNWVMYKPGAELASVVLACCGSLLLLLPKGFVPRWLGMILFLPLVAPAVSGPGTADLSVQVLDVGQGLSIIFGTENHAVVYDAGPAFSARFDAGEQIVAPSIRMSGYNQVHTLVISHSDTDHSGGVKGLESRLRIQQRLTSFEGPGLRCRAGQQWQLDGVSFRILLGGIEATDNNRSCVLLVQAGDISILVPGDIEQLAENLLLDVELPYIDVMLAPHHGSLTSSSPAFLNHVAPGLVIVSAGYKNRFNHPHPTVVARYSARQVRLLNTAYSGSILLQVHNNQLSVDTARGRYRRFWYD